MTSCTYRGAEYHPSQKAGTQILGAGVYRGVSWKRRSMKLLLTQKEILSGAAQLIQSKDHLVVSLNKTRGP